MGGKSNAIVLLLLLLSDLGHSTANSLHMLAEAMKLVFTDPVLIWLTLTKFWCLEKKRPVQILH